VPLRIKRNTTLPADKKDSKEADKVKDPINIPFYPTIEYEN